MECPICLDSEGGEFLKLECGHFIHEHCSRGLIKKECPMCRSTTITFPSSVLDTINKNAKKYREDLVEEESRNLSFENTTPIPIRIMSCVLVSLVYYMCQKIPIGVLPLEIKITREPKGMFLSDEEVESFVDNIIWCVKGYIQNQEYFTVMSEDDIRKCELKLILNGIPMKVLLSSALGEDYVRDQVQTYEEFMGATDE